MNNKTILIAFLLAGTLLTGTTAMTQAYAEDDDYDKRHDDDKRYDKGGDGNKQKVEDDSAGAIADCDKNEVERADFDCIAAAATDESTIGTGDGDGDGNGDGNGNGAECDLCIEVFLEALEADVSNDPLVTAALALFDCGDFDQQDIDTLIVALEAVPLIDADAVADLEQCLEDLLGATA